MRCPKCEGDMLPIEYQGVAVDRCSNCQGIWFDVGESDWLRDREAAAAIDTGDASIGREQDRINRYRCPRCNGGMLRRYDPQRTDIWYEECTSCRGSFFDAGEFRGLTEEAVSGAFRQLAGPGRDSEP